MEKIKVLIADDIVSMAEVLKQQLEKFEDVEVVGIAVDGQDEVEKIEELKPDLVFTDNQMPKLNGIDVVDFVRNSAIEKKPDFVIITGDNDFDLMKRAFSLDVLRLIHKPCDERKITEVLEQYRQKVTVFENIEETAKNIKEIVKERKEKEGFLSKIINKFKERK